jgi:hypothetical protein
MNTYTVTISSASSNVIETLPQIDLEDFTELSLNISNVYSKVIPIFIKIDWGDGVQILYDNDVYTTTTADTINTSNYNTVLNTIYSSKIYPSPTTLYKNLHAQLYISYSNGDYSWFKLPISVRTNDFFESIGDLKLVNVNILPVEGNPKEYQLSTFIDNTILELHSSN